MEAIRRYNVRLLETQIRINDENITHNTESIKNIKRNIADRDFVEIKVSKIEFTISKLNEDQISLHQKIIQIQSGDFDHVYQKEKDEAAAKYEEDYFKKKKKKENKFVSKKLEEKETEEKFIKERKQGKANENEMDRGLKYFYNVSDSIPDYMTAKLKNMPNNKGYIWRGVHLYGYKDAEKNQPISMFEKKGALLIIHEWTPNEYRVYEKMGEAAKVIKSCTLRNCIKEHKSINYIPKKK